MAYALDCEMIAVVLPTSKKLKSIAARVSIVDSFGIVVIDEYCQPPYEVYSYNTEYSGITPNHLIGKMSYEELRSVVSAVIENKLIVGHDLKNDFRALGINHPARLRFDTANDRTLRELAHLPINKKPKLAKLVSCLTGKLIQKGAHDSVEDAKAAMELYKIVSQRKQFMHPITGLSTQELTGTQMTSQKAASSESRNSVLWNLGPRIQNWINYIRNVAFVFLLAIILHHLFFPKQAI